MGNKEFDRKTTNFSYDLIHDGDVFRLGFTTKNETFTIEFTLTKNQVHEIINEILTALNSNDMISEFQHIDHVELLMDENGYILDIGHNDNFASLKFANKHEVESFVSLLKSNSEWNVEVLQKSKNYQNEIQGEDKYRTKKNSSEWDSFIELMKPVNEYFSDHSSSEIVDEIIRSVNESLTISDLSLLPKYEKGILISNFFKKLGYPEMRTWVSIEYPETDNKYHEIQNMVWKK